jgi:2-haloacid dehalogenase
MSIDTVVFDIGCVLLDWDPRYLYRKIFADPEAMERFLAEVCTPAWNVQQDGGRPWADAEAEAIARHPTLAAEIRAFRARWHEMIPGAVEASVACLEALHARGVPLYAITNFAADTFAESRARFAFLERFRGVVVSGEERLLKPDVGIYRRLAERYGVDLSRALFIDDSLKNVEGARAAGMAAHHFTTPAAMRQALAAHGFAI